MYSIGNKNHAFNDIVSQKIGMYRILPDTRNKLLAEYSLPVYILNISQC